MSTTTTKTTTTVSKAGHSPTRRPSVPPTSASKPKPKPKAKSKAKPLVSEKTISKVGEGSAKMGKKIEKGSQKFWDKTLTGMNNMNTQFDRILNDAVDQVQGWRED